MRPLIISLFTVVVIACDGLANIGIIRTWSREVMVCIML